MYVSWKKPHIIITEQELGYTIEDTPKNRRIVETIKELVKRIDALTTEIDEQFDKLQ